MPMEQDKDNDKEFKETNLSLRQFLVVYVILNMTVSILIPRNYTFGKII